MLPRLKIYLTLCLVQQFWCGCLQIFSDASNLVSKTEYFGSKYSSEGGDWQLTIYFRLFSKSKNCTKVTKGAFAYLVGLSCYLGVTFGNWKERNILNFVGKPNFHAKFWDWFNCNTNLHRNSVFIFSSLFNY